MELKRIVVSKCNDQTMLIHSTVIHKTIGVVAIGTKELPDTWVFDPAMHQPLTPATMREILVVLDHFQRQHDEKIAAVKAERERKYAEWRDAEPADEDDHE